MDVLLFPPLLMKCLFYHACQALLAHEKVICCKGKKKKMANHQGKHIVAGEILETVGLNKCIATQTEGMVDCSGLSESF